MDIEVRHATGADLERAVAHARQEDKDEFCRYGLDPMEEVRKAAKEAPVWIAEIGGDPIAIYSCRPQTVLGRTGLPWLMASHRISEKRVLRAMAAHGGTELKRACTGFSRLLVAKRAESKRDIRWLERFGFKVEREFVHNGESLCMLSMNMEA